MARIMVLEIGKRLSVVGGRLASVHYRLNYVGHSDAVEAGILELRSGGGRQLGHHVCHRSKAIYLLISSQEPRGQRESQVRGLGFQFDFESQGNRKLLTAEKPHKRDHWMYYFKQTKAKCNNCFLPPPLGNEIEVSRRKIPRNRLIGKGMEGIRGGWLHVACLRLHCSFHFSFSRI